MPQSICACFPGALYFTIYRCLPLERCDELWLCTGQLSSGMRRELAHAQRLGMPVRDRAQDWRCLAAEGAELCMLTQQG